MKKRKYVASNEQKKSCISEKRFGIRLKDAEFGVSTDVFGLALLCSSIFSLCSLPYFLNRPAHLLTF